MWAIGRRHVEMRDETERKENDKKKVVENVRENAIGLQN